MTKQKATGKHTPASAGVKTNAKKATSAKNSGGILGMGWGLLSLLGISSLLFLIARLQLLAVPLERDEGSFTYIGHWLLKGRELYTHMLDSKLPGLYIFYGFFTTLFGYNATGAHIGLLFANIASAICFYLLLKDIYNRFIAVVATSLFLWLVLSPNVVGFAAHATQLLTPFVIGGFLLFWRGLNNNKLYMFLLAGLMIGIAFTIKQQSAIFGILMAILWWPARLLWNKKPGSKLPFLEWVLLGVGGFFPAALVVGYFYQVGRFDQFLDWTVMQPINLAGAYQKPWYEMFYSAVPLVFKQFEGVWIAAVAGFGLIFMSGLRKFGTVFGIGFAVMGFLSVIIGAAYYKHYFVVAMPGIALMAACTFYWISKKAGSYGQPLAIGIVAVLILFGIRGKSYYYFSPDYAKIHFEQYAQNMFPELELIGEELAKRVPEGQKIAILGSEPEVLVAAGRESCSKHLMVYSMLIDPVLSPPFQKEYMQELFDCQAEYLVWATGTGSWAPGYDGLMFFEKILQWLEQNYETIGIAESRDDKPGLILWDDQLKGHQRQTDYVIFVFKKRPVPLSPEG